MKEPKEKKKINKKINKKRNKKSNKKIIFAIIVIFIVIISICWIQRNKKSNNTNNNIENLSEFEKIAVYKYVEDKFLNNNLLPDLVESGINDSMDESSKLEYTIGYFMKKNNKNIASLDEVRETYNNLFGQAFNENDYTGHLLKYEYNVSTKSYEVRKDANIDDNPVSVLKISEIIENGPDENIVKIDILQLKNIDEFINYFSSFDNFENLEKLNEIRRKNTVMYDKDQFNYLKTLITDENVDNLTEKVQTAELKLKVHNNDYAIIDYKVQNITD